METDDFVLRFLPLLSRGERVVFRIDSAWEDFNGGEYESFALSRRCMANI